MRTYLTLVGLLIFGSVAHSESWIEVSGDYECPGLLVLTESKYEIFNDCYGFDPRNPIVESGSYERKDGVIIFSNRKIEHPSFLGDEGNTELEVIVKTKNELSIRSGRITHSFNVYPVAK